MGAVARPVGRPRSEACRTAILGAAYDVLTREGLARLTIERVAASAGVGRSTIYRWWPSRGTLAVECLLEAVRKHDQPSETGDVTRDLAGYIARSIGIMRAEPGQIVASIVAQGQSDPATLSAYRAGYLQHRRLELEKILSSGVRRGQLRPDLDIPTTIDLLFGGLLYHLLGLGALDEERLAARLVESVLRGARTVA